MLESAGISSTVCARHKDRDAVAACADCGEPMCWRCVVEIPSVGVLCWPCASRRGGLRARRRPDHEGERSPAREPSPARELRPLVADESEDAVRRFEAACSDRDPHPLISGLSARLEDAGADPEDVVDDEALLADISRLQARANEPAPTSRRRWRRR
jgi:hypothetical protein